MAVYKNITSRAIIRKIMRDLQTTDDNWIDDAIEWMGEALEHIGASAQLEEKGCVLTIKNYRADLPADLYYINQVAINNNVKHTLGAQDNPSTSNSMEGYMAEVVFIDGTAYNPTTFAEEKNGVWIPKDFSSSVTFGSNGWYLKFENASDLGNDSSGNNNDWTANNMGADHQVLDSPTFGS